VPAAAAAAAADFNTRTVSVLEHVYFAPVGVLSIAMNVSVCLSVRLHISRTTCPNFIKFSVHVNCGGGLVPSDYIVQYFRYFWFCG